MKDHFDVNMRERLRYIKSNDDREWRKAAKSQVDDANKFFQEKMVKRLDRKKKDIKEALYNRLKRNINQLENKGETQSELNAADETMRTMMARLSSEPNETANLTDAQPQDKD